MVIAVGDIYAQIPQRAEVQELVLELQARALQAPGCVSFVLGAVLGDPGHFLVVQRWQDRASLEEHYRSAAFTRYQSAVQALLVRDSDLEVYDVEAAFRLVDPHELDLRQDD